MSFAALPFGCSPPPLRAHSGECCSVPMAACRPPADSVADSAFSSCTRGAAGSPSKLRKGGVQPPEDPAAAAGAKAQARRASLAVRAAAREQQQQKKRKERAAASPPPAAQSPQSPATSPSPQQQAVRPRPPHAPSSAAQRAPAGAGAAAAAQRRSASLPEVVRSRSPPPACPSPPAQLLPSPPAPARPEKCEVSERREASDAAAAESTFQAAADQLAMFRYNHDGVSYSIDKTRSVADLLQQGAAILRNREVFGRIQCVEGAFVGLLLTQECFQLTRFGISFETGCGDRVHRHLVLGVMGAGHFGALGISRGKGLGCKPLKAPTLLELVRDYEKAYGLEGHELIAVVLGRPVPHLMTCTKVYWSFMRIKIRGAEPMAVADACSRYERHIVAAAAIRPEAVVGISPKRGASGFSLLRHSFPPPALRQARGLLPITEGGAVRVPVQLGPLCNKGPFAPLLFQQQPQGTAQLLLFRRGRDTAALASAVLAAALAGSAGADRAAAAREREARLSTTTGGQLVPPLPRTQPPHQWGRRPGPPPAGCGVPAGKAHCAAAAAVIRAA